MSSQHGPGDSPLKMRGICQDCDWTDTWYGVSIKNDPSTKHIVETGHGVKVVSEDEE